jgi:hypothetical protein
LEFGVYAKKVLKNIQKRIGIKVTLSGKQIESLLLPDLKQNCKSYVPSVEVDRILRYGQANALNGHITKFTFNEYLIEMRDYYGAVEEEKVVVNIKTMKSYATLIYWNYGNYYGPGQSKKEIYVRFKVSFLFILG